MAIAINGSSNTITGLAVGGLPDGIVDADMLAANAVTEAKLATSPQQGLAKAWVNFDSNGTLAVTDSFNVSSVTDNGVGDYTINFTSAFANTNYCIVGACEQRNTPFGSYAENFQIPVGATKTTSAARVCTNVVTPSSSAAVDEDRIYVVFFGD